MTARVLIVAGSDSGGGAGIQADIKTVMALQGYAMTAITALTAQDTTGVHGIVPVDPGFIRQQISAVARDIGVDVVKTGMLGDRATIEAVAGALEAECPDAPLVVDPVMVAKGGARLLDDAAVGSLSTRLAARATLLTPNLPEAEVLSGLALEHEESRDAAAARLRDMGAGSVLIKGGHTASDRVRDLLVTPDERHVLEGARLHTRNRHGTGCTLASACATGLAQGRGMAEAVARARAYVRRAMETAPDLGHGHGPLNHGCTVGPFEA